MRAAGPAAGTTHTRVHFRDTFFNPNLSRLRLLAGGNPTDPLIARQWGNTLPQSGYLFIGVDRLFKIRGESVHKIILLLAQL